MSHPGPSGPSPVDTGPGPGPPTAPPRPDRAAGVVGLVVSLLGAGLVMAVAAAATGEPFDDLVQDPTADLGNWRVGALSNLGVLGWWTGATCAVFGGLLVRTARPRTAGLLIGAGVLTAVLALDDMLQIHDQALPARDVPDGVAALVYAVAVAVLGVRYRDVLATTPRVPLVTAVVLLMASVAIDAVVAEGASYASGEDVLKLLGIAAWTAHWGALAGRTVRDGMAPPAPPRAV